MPPFLDEAVFWLITMSVAILGMWIGALLQVSLWLGLLGAILTILLIILAAHWYSKKCDRTQ